MELEQIGNILKAVMLICFGVSWPTSIAKAVRTKFVRGKSLFFLWIIFSGYVAGICMEIFAALEKNQDPHWLLWLFVINLLLVGTDIFFYYKYRHNQEAQTDTLIHDIAETLEEQEGES